MMRTSFLLPITAISSPPISLQLTRKANAPWSTTLVDGVRRYSDGMGLVQARNLVTDVEERVFVPVSLTTGLFVSMH